MQSFYCQKMLDQSESNEFAWVKLEEAMAEAKEEFEVLKVLQRKLEKPLVDLFRPIYDRNPSRDGFVTVQGDPIHEDDSSAIVSEAIANHALGENVCPKIPVTKAGLGAIPSLVAEGIPIVATEVFGVAQAISLLRSV